MKQSIKLKNMVEEQWEHFKMNECYNEIIECENCPFKYIDCNEFELEDAWVNHKDLFSDKFLDQEVEIEDEELLSEEDKEKEIKMKLNKIYLGDAYELIKQIPDKSIDLIVTDPPYEINSLTGGGMLKEKRIENLMDSLENENLHIGIKEDILNEFIRVCKKINVYIWCNKTLIPKLLDFFVIKHKCTFDIITWHKTNAMPLCGGKYLTDTEYCLYFKDGVKLNTTYDTAKTHYELPINIQDKALYSHPTIKPIQIIKNLITNSSLEGGGSARPIYRFRNNSCCM